MLIIHALSSDPKNTDAFQVFSFFSPCSQGHDEILSLIWEENETNAPSHMLPTTWQTVELTSNMCLLHVSQQTGAPTVISSSPHGKAGKCYPDERKEDSMKCGL